MLQGNMNSVIEEAKIYIIAIVVLTILCAWFYFEYKNLKKIEARDPSKHNTLSISKQLDEITVYELFSSVRITPSGIILEVLSDYDSAKVFNAKVKTYKETSLVMILGQLFRVRYSHTYSKSACINPKERVEKICTREDDDTKDHMLNVDLYNMEKLNNALGSSIQYNTSTNSANLESRFHKIHLLFITNVALGIMYVMERHSANDFQKT